MIARIWHGQTKIDNYEEYTGFLKRVAIPDYRNTEGFKGLTFLRNKMNNVAYFTLITFWETLK